MTQQKPPDGWGPQRHVPATREPRWLLALILLFLSLTHEWIFTLLIVCAVAVGIWRLRRRYLTHTSNRMPAWRPVDGIDPLQAVLAQSRRLGGGVYLGLARTGGWRLARRERAVLILGPPRSGKTSGVIIPAVLTHGGAVVSTSTKPDVLSATAASRRQLGRVWRFDPTGTTSTVPGVEGLRWSPVSASRSWDGALLIARAMVTGAGVGTGTTDQSHWSRRAQALLAPLLHAAACSELGIDKVHGWVLNHDLDTPGVVLRSAGAELAGGIVTGLQNTEARERSSIFSAAADALDAYASHAALDAASDPNFNAQEFVCSSDSIFIDAPADRQHLAAPLVCGLLAEIRQATYQAHQRGQLRRQVLFALDEVANIAPLDELPQIAAEGGGQGLLLLAALQDLSQARARWGPAAEGFLTLFGAKLILPGIADERTLESVSVALGEYDRPVVSDTRTRQHGPWGSQRSQTVSTQRQRVLSAGEVANIPAGHGLHLDGVRWELLTLTPAHQIEPWATLTRTTAAVRS